MPPLDYRRAGSAAEAIALAADHRDAVFLAGGTEVVNWLKQGIVAPPLLIDLTGCDLGRITWNADTLSIGALARLTAIAAHSDVRQAAPAVAQALEATASPAIRQMATLAGNLLQRTRCPYFLGTRHSAFGTRPSAERRVPSAECCNRREAGSGCGAGSGDQRGSAIFGASLSCIATHPSDVAVVLAVLEAELVVEGEAGRRTLAVEGLYPAVADPAVENTLVRGELITSIRVPLGRAASRTRYLKIRDRSSFDFAVVAAAGYLIVEDGLIAEARLALGGVAARPWRARTAEAHLIGRKPGPEVVARAMGAELAGAVLLPGNRYKAELAVRAATKVLLEPEDLA